MEFEGQYLTYEEYKALGGTLDLMPFNLLEFEARRKIDINTQNRLKNINVEDIPQEVKICEFNIINIIIKYNNDKQKNISSESVGSWSVSYNTNIKELVQEKSYEIDDIIFNHLIGVIVNGEHLPYLGVENAN